MLIKDNHVVGILYNSGSEVLELPFFETKIDLSKLVQIYDENLFGLNVVIAKIEKIPFCMCAARD